MENNNFEENSNLESNLKTNGYENSTIGSRVERRYSEGNTIQNDTVEEVKKENSPMNNDFNKPSKEDNKKTKKYIIFAIVGVIALILGIILIFISNIKRDQKELNSRIKKIDKEYAVFKTDLEAVSAKRDELHKEFIDTIYYETFQTNDTGYKNKLQEYEEMVNNVSKKNKTLKEYCNAGIYYSQTETNNKCSAFNLGYEEMVNSFVEDVSSYNKNIENYNKWLDSKNDTTSIKLEKYKTNKTYIDFNKDGEYSGKGVSNDEKTKTKEKEQGSDDTNKQTEEK